MRYIGIFVYEAKNFLKDFCVVWTSSSNMYKQGTITKVMPVAKRIPYPSDRAMGIINRACREVSKIIGDKPPNVVSVVSMIGRKRRDGSVMPKTGLSFRDGSAPIRPRRKMFHTR